MQVDMLIFAEAATIREGLINILGGGMDTFQLQPAQPGAPKEVPRPDGTMAKVLGNAVRLNIVMRVSTPAHEAGKNTTFVLRIVEPDGALVSQGSLNLVLNSHPERPKGWDLGGNILFSLDIFPTAVGEHRLDVEHEGIVLKSMQFRMMGAKTQVVFKP